MAVSGLLSLLPVGLMAAVGLVALARDVDVYAALMDGAGEGLRVLWRMAPALVCLLPAVALLRQSGAVEALSRFLAPLLTRLGIPPETVTLLLLRPVSGSAALAAGSEILAAFGADSLPGRTAAVMLGSTETTFYVLSVYFGAAGIKKSRHALPAALCADLAGFLAAAWTVRFLMR